MVYVVPAASIAALDTRGSAPGTASGSTHGVTVPVSSSIAAPARMRASEAMFESRTVLPSGEIAGLLPLISEAQLGVHGSNAPSSVDAAIPPRHGQPATSARLK